jgi:hypothetical protein
MTSKPPQLKNKEQIRFIALLPKRIRAAVLSDKRLSAIDIPTENILTLSDETFDAAIFNAAIQRLYDTDIKKVAITDRDDQVWQMTLTSKHEVELQRAKKTIKLWDQRYLSTNTRRRLNGFRARSKGVLPKAPYKRFETLLKSRPFAEEELLDFDEACQTSLTRVQSNLKHAINSNLVSWDDLVPTNPQYIQELLMGAELDDADLLADKPITTESESVPDLSPLDVAKRWLLRSAAREISYAMIQSLALELEDVQKLLFWVQSQHSPGLSIAFLDYVTARAAGEHAFRGMAKDALERHLAWKDDPAKWYGHFASIFRGVYGHISMKRCFDIGQANQKRLFAWSQTNLIMATLNDEATIAGLADWMNEQTVEYCTCALTVEQKHLPRWSMKECTASSFFADHLARFFCTINQFWDAALAEDLVALVKQPEVEAVFGKQLYIQFFCPGVLEGGTQPSELMPDAMLKETLQQVTKRPFDFENLIALTNTIPRYRLPDELVTEIQSALNSISIQYEGFPSTEANFYAWFELSRLAVQIQDLELAQLIGISVWKAFSNPNSPMAPRFAAYLFLLLSSAVDPEDQYVWLRSYFTKLSLAVDDHDPAWDYFAFLRALRTVNPELSSCTSAAYNNLRLYCKM